MVWPGSAGVRQRCRIHARADACVTSFQIRKSFGSEPTVISGREKMAPKSEVGADDPVHLDEALRVPGGLETPPESLAFTPWLMSVFSAVVQVAMLTMSDVRHHD